MAHHHLVIVCALFCLLNGVDSQPPVHFPPQDMAGLQGLWGAWKTNNPTRALRTLRNWGNESALPCRNDFNYSVSSVGWNGVGCDFQQTNASTGGWNATVSMLILRNCSLVGVLPPQVSLLSNLQYLYLGNNPGLSGSIPKEIGLLSVLDSLDLSWSNFSGQVPDLSNLTSLHMLDLSGNQLNGSFPTLPRSWKFRVVNVSNNLFKGTIFQDTFQIVENFLTTLDLSNNQFTCPLPKNFARRLDTLSLSNNNFTCSMPNLTYLTKLTSLDLSNNQFTCPLSEFARTLKTLSLSSNNFTCSMPDFTYLTELTALNLSANRFKGLSNNMSSSLNHIFPKKLSVLDLSSLNIGGPLPMWSSVTPSSQLSELYLDRNNFTGILDIAAFMESNLSRSLRVLSLKNNMITNVRTSNELIRAGQILLKGNPYCDITWTSRYDATWCSLYCEDLCKRKPEPKKSQRITLLLATTLSSVALVLVIVILGLAFKLRRNRECIVALQRKIKEADINAKRFEYNELRVATKNFAPEMKLGAGAYGAVYKGILANDVIIAVKQLFQETNKGREDFVNEVLLIANLQHKNLVTLKGYSLHGKQTLLVYEYVENCDLHKLLLSSEVKSASMDKQMLNWGVRLNICQGVAQGLYYLHASSQSRIIHRDIKASNILLDKNLQPKIADFGLARPIEDARSMIITSQCAGTIGYVAPEYMEYGWLSDKADVYSFGVLLLEIVSGKRNRDLSMPDDEVYLPSRAWKLHKEKRLLDMKDPLLLVSLHEATDVHRVLEIAVLCVQIAPEKRPSMFQVAAMLAGDVDVVSKDHDSFESDRIWG